MKVGFCALLGRPNVGKSTLLNALLSHKISIVTPKAQTTRDDIVGVYNEKSVQIVFVDTPGLFEGEEALYKIMYRSARSALASIDVVLYLIDATQNAYEYDDKMIKSLKTDAPIILVYNKIDLVTIDKMIALKDHYNSLFPSYKKIEISALTNFGLKDIKEAIKGFLKEGMPYYPQDMITDRDKPFMAKEIIREQILHFLKNEIPHECAVVISSFSEEKGAYFIEATIACEKESQKRIIIGSGGQMIKKISMNARRSLEKMWQSHVTLKCLVNVVPGWRNNLQKLAKLGYGKQTDEE